MSKRVAFLTLGCKVNQYETDAMEELLKNHGYTTVDFKSEADVYVVHTCSVTNMADKKSRQMLQRARRMNPQGVVVAVGCYVQANQAEIIEKGIADILIGNNQKGEIAEILNSYFEKRERESHIVDISKEKEYESLMISNITGHTRAYIKVQDGCNQFCSYCIIPYTRGRIRSEKPERVLEEVKSLAARGFKEIVLTGIHLSSYGLETGESNLLSLIQMIHDVEGIERIRLGSLEPRIITEDFVRELVQLKKVCPHFHLSLQSGCDETLRRMNRRYSSKEYQEALQILRRYYEEPALTTDVIVGFVGESEEEFQQTKEYLEEINLYEMHIFKYSVREGTRAQKMSGHIAEHVKNQRSAELLAMAAKHKLQYEKKFIDKMDQILLEELISLDGKQYYQGYTSRYLRVALPYSEEKKGKMMPNQLLNIRITALLDENLLLAEIVE